MSQNLLQAKNNAYHAEIYISESGEITLAFADDGQAIFMSFAEKMLLVGVYEIWDDYKGFTFWATSAKGEIYAESDFKIIGDDIIQEVNTGAKFYRQ